MNRTIRRFLITFLLLVALPFKGFAAAGMLACGPDHHQMYGAIAQHDGMTASTWHDHGDGVSHQHSGDQALESDAKSSSLSADGATLAGHATHLNGKLKCSTCAPCCASAALIDAVSIRFAAAVSGADFPVFAIVHPTAPVGRLDRPPRTVLA